MKTPEELQQDAEANAFATALLMPAPLVILEIAEFHGEKPGAEFEEVVAEMASRFKVSEARMAARMQQIAESL